MLSSDVFTALSKLILGRIREDPWVANTEPINNLLELPFSVTFSSIFFDLIMPSLSIFLPLVRPQTKGARETPSSIQKPGTVGALATM